MLSVECGVWSDGRRHAELRMLYGVYGVCPKHLAALSTVQMTAARFFEIALVLSIFPVTQNDAAGGRRSPPVRHVAPPARSFSVEGRHEP